MFEDYLILNYFKENYSHRKNTLFDVGANVGSFFSKFALTGWKVYAFEPEPKNYCYLKNNYSLFSNVYSVNKAVSNIEKKSDFYISNEHSGIHSLVPFDESHLNKITVDVVRLDNYIHENNIKYINLIKIDTEGSDYNVIKSINFKQTHPEMIMCEYMDSRSKKYNNYTHKDIVNYMKKYGYIAYCSKWSKFNDYSHVGDVIENTKFLSFSKLGNKNVGFWGNLVFIKAEDDKKFGIFLEKFYKKYNLRRKIFRSIPPFIRNGMRFIPSVFEFFYEY